MKKYNLSRIMKRAWALAKNKGMDISSALKKSWREEKHMGSKKVEMNVVGKETFIVDTLTGKVSGKTYNSKDFLKDNFSATWNSEEKVWIVDVEKFESELKAYPDYYKKYIISTESDKEIVSTEIVNRNDGFYKYVVYSDGTHEYIFVG